MTSPASPTAATAVLFPGQGSQTAGMADAVAGHRPDLLEQARAELGADPFDRLGDGTRFAQPAIYCASLAHWKQAGSPVGEMVAGHSLGELAALVAGGALAATDGLRLAVIRGQAMEDAGEAHPGGMLAALGGGEEVAELAVRLGLVVANDNTSPAVLEEVWHVSARDFEGALDGLVGKALTIFSPLLPVTEDALARALSMPDSKLHPNDRLHVGTCTSHEIDTVFTADRAFDGIKGIRRVDPFDPVAVEELLAATCDRARLGLRRRSTASRRSRRGRSAPR